ncbi:hypothetical protein [Aquisalimonas sp.]|uniref:hypothetical protein n=1 Tax=Aquisalimonas sp. TaxID=1872621 RepID=UPI0025BAFB3A|nr:hypothetical protein [Aquisalimonas sp.]
MCHGALICGLLAAGPQRVAADEVPAVDLDPPQSTASSRWGLGVAYGGQWYADEDQGFGDAGTVAAVQLTYRARLETEREGLWLFELGYEYAASRTAPEVAPGREQRVRSHGLFYRFSRYVGPRIFLGGRAGISRVRGPAEKSNLDLVIGLQAGVTLTSWLDAGVEAVAAQPGLDGGRPADVRGVVTVSF